LGLEKLNVPFARTNVGDRYVMAELNNRGWSLGGESSGHIVCLDVTTTGDGIVSALQALAAMISGETQLFDLCRKMQKMPQTMINVRVSDRSLALDHAATLTAVRDIEARLGKQGRVLLRASGTEPVIRVMIEGEDQLLVASMAGELADVIVNGAL
jgi:phosphoglucosamine mutase